MILSFKNRFIKQIMTHKKIHTIRKDKTNRWRSGKTIHMSKNVRTKDQACFKNSFCSGTQKIVIKASVYINDYRVYIDDREINIMEMQDLCWNDGFANIVEFCQWFKSDFEGKIIHWTDFRYQKKEQIKQ